LIATQQPSTERRPILAAYLVGALIVGAAAGRYAWRLVEFVVLPSDSRSALDHALWLTFTSLALVTSLAATSLLIWAIFTAGAPNPRVGRAIAWSIAGWSALQLYSALAVLLSFDFRDTLLASWLRPVFFDPQEIEPSKLDLPAALIYAFVLFKALQRATKASQAPNTRTDAAPHARPAA
jgi:hypothetical protein